MRKVCAVIAAVVCLGLVSASGAYVPDVLKVSAIPDENPNELMRIYAPFAEYLGKELGMKVQFTPVVDYAATVEGLAAKKLDLVWYGGFTSVQAVRRTNGNARRLVLRQEDAEFKSVFIANPASPIKGLADLRKKTFAFGSVSSTSGHLMPRFFLREQGIDPDKDMRVAFSGAHDATAFQVQGGKVDAGALNISVWEKLVVDKKVDPAKVRVFYTTPAYFDYNWSVHADMPAAQRQKLAQAFIELTPATPEGKEILGLQRATRFIATKPENYKGIEGAARNAGLLK